MIVEIVISISYELNTPDFQNGLDKQTFKNIWRKEVFGRVWVYGDLV